ncbi:prokineticin domain-containing protein [Trichonephila inaurata madagascariensis]|uniref:Prokineticin domain-containing protein n=1 Tax=Trichonephila inaurata madagascariensis TaxID=2747483 RepID=A0A8X6YJH3_9ARAC|nr:prokineticin domain-containing protein [Trichonephila inaurata madagascariensis]
MKWVILALVVVSFSQVLAKRCKKAEDCEDGECCVNYVLVSFFGGHCQKLRSEGEVCTIVEKEDEEEPDMYHFLCPCKEGLKCVADRDVKIGEHIIFKRPVCVVPGEEGNKDNTESPDIETE